MKELKIFLLSVLMFFCFNTMIYAQCQIQYDAEADRVLHLGGDTLRGHFATGEECQDYWRSRPWFEQSHSKCVGCNEQNYSQPQQRSQPGVKYLGRDSQGRQTWTVSGPSNRTPEEEEMVRKARRTRNPRAALAAMKRARQQKQLNEQKKQQSHIEFEQDKNKMLTQLKTGSGSGGLKLKGGEKTLALKSGNAAPSSQDAAKVIKDLRNSVYWALKAAKAASSDNNNYEASREYGEYSAQGYPGGDIELPSVPDVPAPVRAYPQVKLYKSLIKKANKVTSEFKMINTNLKQEKDKKKKSEKKINIQKTKIEKLRQKKSESKKDNTQEDVDKLIAAAQAELDKAKKQNEESSKEIVSLNEQGKKQEDNLSKLQQVFDTAEKHPERTDDILIKLEGGK